MKEAMVARDTIRLGVIRSLLALFQSEMIQKNISDEFATDDMATTLIKRAVKQRKDSIEQFKKGNRMDLVETEEAELKILETYLPESMSEDKIRKIAETKKTELNINDKSKMGMLVGAVLKETKGEADGAVVKNVVESLFK